MIPTVTLKQSLLSQGKFTEAEQIRVAPRPTTPDVNTGSGCHFWNMRGPCSFGNAGTRGYGVELNMAPGHQRGVDGVLAFDMNCDGRYDKRDVQRSNDMMKAAGNNFDFNQDGCTDRFEAIRGQRLRSRYSRLDQNSDGRLSGNEIHNSGGKIWIDRSGEGGIDSGELYSPLNINSASGLRRLDYVDPLCGTSQTTPMAFGINGNYCYPGR
jgi:hypothetical protein